MKDGVDFDTDFDTDVVDNEIKHCTYGRSMIEDIGCNDNNNNNNKQQINEMMMNSNKTFIFVGME
jgi:tRNA U34 2-thiouridine synthase MnmA/TrmU